MTCGISCPISDGSKLGFFLRLLCNGGSWIMCSPLSLVFIIIGIVAFYFIWTRTEEDKRDKIGIFFKLGLLILLLIIFFPSIKAFLFTSPYITPDSCEDYNNDVCKIEGASDELSHTPLIATNWWKFYCVSDGIIKLEINPISSCLPACYLNQTEGHFIAFEVFYTQAKDLTPNSEYTVGMTCPTG